MSMRILGIKMGLAALGGMSPTRVMFIPLLILIPLEKLILGLSIMMIVSDPSLGAVTIPAQIDEGGILIHRGIRRWR